MGHARLSPSSAERWFNCPGSVRECAKYPESRSSDAAIDGTHTHTVLEHLLLNPNVEPLSLVGDSMSDHDGEFTIDKARIDRVIIALDYINDRLVETGAHDLRPERKVNAGLLIGRDDIKGTADVQLLSSDTLEIMDYKDGMGIVDPVENKQMSIYAIGAMVMHKSAVGYPFSKVRLTIIQPKLVVKGFEPVRYWETTVDDLLKFAEEMKLRAEETDKPDAPLVPGDSQCKWCEHKGACSAYINRNMEGVSLMFEDVAKQAADKEPTELSDGQIREIVESAPSVRQMLEAVEKEALRRIESGHNVDGLKVVRTAGRRSWSYSEEEMADKLKRMSIPKSAMYVTKLVSPAQVEKLSWEKKKGDDVIVKKLSPRQLKTLQTEYVRKSSGGMKVVPESENGDAVVFDVSPMFNEINVPGGMVAEPNQLGSIDIKSDIPDWMK